MARGYQRSGKIMNDKRIISPHRRRVLGGFGAATITAALAPRARATEAPLPVEPWSK
jgi:hypothetical protein